MQRDTAVDLIKARLSRVRDTTLTELIQNELILTQNKLEHSPFLPWFLVELKTDLTTVAAQDYVDVPTGFLREVDDDEFRIVYPDGYWGKVRKGDPSDLGSQSGLPTRYARIGMKFYFSPIPDQVYTLRLRYYKSDTELTSNITNLWLTHGAEVLITETSLMIAQKYIKDMALAKTLETDTLIAQKRLRDFTQSLFDTNREYMADD